MRSRYGLSDEKSEFAAINELKLNTKDGITVTNDTITAAIKHIEKYVESRDKLTYVAPFRLLYE